MNKFDFKKNLLKDKWFFIGIFILNFIWFFPLITRGIIMGDDNSYFAVNWRYEGSLLSAFLYSRVNRYRPIFKLAQILEVNLFGNSYQLYFFFNILFNILISWALFKLFMKITEQNYFVCSFFTAFYIIAPFSYYNITQLTGLMEAMCLLFFLLLISFIIKYWAGDAKAFYFAVIFLLLLVFTHERYVVLAPWLVLIALVKEKRLLQRLRLSMLGLIPLVLNIFIKKVILSTRFLEGTGGQAIELDLFSILKFFTQGLLSILGINNGPEYLNVYTFREYPSWLKVFAILAVLMALFTFFVYLMQFIIQEKDHEARRGELALLFIAASGIGALILSGSITIRLEARWLYAPYILYLLYFSYILSKVKIYFHNIPAVLLPILFVMIIENTSYRSHIDRLFFMRAMNLGRSVYEATIDRYGESLSDYELYFIGNHELRWVIGTPPYSIFDVYLDSDVKLSYVESADSVGTLPSEKPKKLYRMNDNLTLSELPVFEGYRTAQTLYDPQLHQIMPETYADTPTGTGLCFLSENSFTIISGYTDTIENITFPSYSSVYFYPTMPYQISDGARVKLSLDRHGVDEELVCFDIVPGEEISTDATLLSLENELPFIADIKVQITSPSGDVTADWVTFNDFKILIAEGTTS